MLRIELKIGESVRIGDIATITLEDKAGKTARIAFDADRSVPITRVTSQGSSSSVAARRGIAMPEVA